MNNRNYSIPTKFIHDRVEIDGVEYQAVRGGGCKGCVASDYDSEEGLCLSLPLCSSTSRPDNLDAIYKPVIKIKDLELKK